MKKRMPIRDSAQLGLDLYNKWREVLYYPVENEEKKMRFRNFELSRDKNKVRIVFQGVESVIGFRKSVLHKKSLHDFFVCFPSGSEDYLVPVEKAIDKTIERFNVKEKRIYKTIFGKENPVVSMEDIEFKDQINDKLINQIYKDCLSVTTPIINLTSPPNS